MNIIVMKFGGTSVAGIEKLKNIVNIVSKEIKNNKVVVVLSAMAGETNRLQDYFNTQYTISASIYNNLRILYD